MTTLTIKINERSKKRKALLEFANKFINEGKDVEIIESDSKAEKKGKSIYSEAFIKKMKRAEENIKNGEVTRLNLDDIWGSIL